MRRAILLCLALALQGCLGPPDTFGDMRKQLEGASVPEDFILVGKREIGMRSGFMAAPPPTTSNVYSAPWDDGALCERVRELLASYGEVDEIASGTCGYGTMISSGWTAWAVNVWSYQLEGYAADPDVVMKRRAGDDCGQIRKRHEEQTPGNYYSRDVPCWVTPGEALVTITVEGKVGW